MIKRFLRWFSTTVFVGPSVHRLGNQLHHLHGDVVLLKELQMTLQEKIDGVTAAIDTATTGIKADIQALKDAIANGQTVDFTALDAKVAALAALDAENPAPAPLTAKKK